MVNWTAASHGSIPRQAFGGGADPSSGEHYYVGRGIHKGMQIPGKVHPSHRCLYISYGGKELKLHQYEVLQVPSGDRSVAWIDSGNGNVPHGALPAGRDSSGETLYIGRASLHGGTVIGKVHPSHKCLYAPYAGKEHSIKRYQVLVVGGSRRPCNNDDDSSSSSDSD